MRGAFVRSGTARYNTNMDLRQRTSAIDGGSASGRTSARDCADEFADTLSLEDLATRWSCSVKTARGRVVKHGLGINPAGTWLVSRRRVRDFEESLCTGSADKSRTSAAAQPGGTRDQVREGLAKLRILRSRRLVPDMGEGAGGPAFRKAG